MVALISINSCSFNTAGVASYTNSGPELCVGHSLTRLLHSASITTSGEGGKISADEWNADQIKGYSLRSISNSSYCAICVYHCYVACKYNTDLGTFITYNTVMYRWDTIVSISSRVFDPVLLCSSVRSVT